jgi:hypothetical protein
VRAGVQTAVGEVVKVFDQYVTWMETKEKRFRNWFITYIIPTLNVSEMKIVEPWFYNDYCFYFFFLIFSVKTLIVTSAL